MMKQNQFAVRSQLHIHLNCIRTFDKKMQSDIYQKMKTTAENIALSSGATAEVTINPGSPVTYNDLALTEKMLPSLQRSAGKEN